MILSTADQRGPRWSATGMPLSLNGTLVVMQRGPRCKAVRALRLGKIAEIIAHFAENRCNVLTLSGKKMHALFCDICVRGTTLRKICVKIETVCKVYSEFLTIASARRNYSVPRLGHV